MTRTADNFSYVKVQTLDQIEGLIVSSDKTDYDGQTLNCIQIKAEETDGCKTSGCSRILHNSISILTVSGVPA